MTFTASDLCPAHQEAYDACLDYRLPRPPIQLCTPGVTTARDVHAARTARFQDWKNTITQQQAQIIAICAKEAR